MHRVTGIAALSVLLLAAAAVTAQPVTVRQACKADVQKTCAGVEPGGGRIQACMKDHFAEFSEPCQQAIITAKVGRR